jgi:hypothetical protein
MKALNKKAESLVKLAMLEAYETLEEKLWIDFKVKTKDFDSLTQNKMCEIFELLYTVLCDVVEDHGNLQSEYDPETII